MPKPALFPKPKRGTDCRFCGERRATVFADCECYDDDRRYCRPEHPNPCCPNGTPICNKCASGEL